MSGQEPRGGHPQQPYAVGPPVRVSHRTVGQPESAAANRSWWDAEAADYYAEHHAVLGDARLMWGPEGVYETDLRLLGDLRGQDVLEFGAGGAQGSRWCAAQGARVVATDLSLGMLRQGLALDAAHQIVDQQSPVDQQNPYEKPGTTSKTSPQSVGVVSYVQCDAVHLPFADASFDTVFSAYGALPFVADSAGLLREVARMLRPGGRLAFSVTHPIRWALPDVPGEAGLTVRSSYFDRSPYVEEDASGRATYTEHHRTLGDRVREIVGAGLALVDLVEPEWPEESDHEWGGWSRLRGELIPGTAIFVCEKPTHD